MKSYTLSPLNDFPCDFLPFKHLIDGLNRNSAFLSYNIEKMKEDAYKITLAVPGFIYEDLSITVHDNLLTIKGAKEKVDESDSEYLHKGIRQENFEKSFQIGDFFLIDQANLDNGLLTITMTRQIPEEKKPKIIPIQTLKKASELIN